MGVYSMTRSKGSLLADDGLNSEGEVLINGLSSWVLHLVAWCSGSTWDSDSHNPSSILGVTCIFVL